MTPIRVLIADDSMVFTEVIKTMIDAEPDMEVIGTVENGKQAIEVTVKLSPDIIVMDVDMPVMDGLSSTTRIMAEHPTPILVVTADPFRNGVDLSFQALSMGALDLVAKPNSFPWPDDERRVFLNKIRILAHIPVVRHLRGSLRKTVITPIHAKPKTTKGAVVGIVASTGGPSSLATLLKTLPTNFPAPIVIVQHISVGFIDHLAEWLDANSDVGVSVATPGTTLQAGHVYLAPDKLHTTITRDRTVRLADSEAVSGHRPSGDLLLESLARSFGKKAIGVVMSGMGDDGTRGMTAIFRSGGTTFVQDKDSCVVYGMPQTALDLGVVTSVETIDKMARALVLAVRNIEAAQ